VTLLYAELVMNVGLNTISQNSISAQTQYTMLLFYKQDAPTNYYILGNKPEFIYEHYLWYNQNNCILSQTRRIVFPTYMVSMAYLTKWSKTDHIFTETHLLAKHSG
jgi:hypothetical protein